MKLDEIPSYLKNSEIYKILVSKGVKTIASENIPVYNPKAKNLTFNNFIEMVRCLYFWKVDLNDFPNEFYVYIYNNKSLTGPYLKKYKNSITGNLPIKIDELYLSTIIEQNYNISLLKYVIENQITNAETLFKYFCEKNKIELVTFMVNKYKDKVLNINEGMIQSAINGNINVLEFLLNHGADLNYKENHAFLVSVYANEISSIEMLLKYGANIHANNDSALTYVIAGKNYEIINILLEHSVLINKKYSSYFLSQCRKNTIDYKIRQKIDDYLKK